VHCYGRERLHSKRLPSSRLVPEAPPPTSPQASIAMRGNKRKDTRPELAVRKALTALGYRYRLHSSDLPGRPDIVFRGRRIAIFVHGCFWHQHSNVKCHLRGKPRSNLRYWEAKLARNVRRDREDIDALTSAGWHVVVVWECETQSPSTIARALAEVLTERRPKPMKPKPKL